MIDLSLVKPCRTSEHKLHWFTGRVISFQVQAFLRGESGALLLIPCSLGPSESFQCDKIELGELLLRGGLNEGTELPGMLHILQENKDPSSLSPEGKRNTNCTWLYWELCKALKPLGSFPLHLPLLPFLFLVEFPGFPKPILFSHSTFLPCQREGWLYMVLPWKHLLDTGWRWVREGSDREAEKPKCRSPTRILSSAGIPGFCGFICTVQNFVSEPGNVAHCRDGKKGQMLSLVISLPPPKSLSDFPYGSLLPACSTPSPFLGHCDALCSQSRAHSLWVVLATWDVQRGPEPRAAIS